MPQMPEFVLQLEQASGLPWWCLLLLAVLVLIILILAVSLSREKRRNRIGAVDIPRGTTASQAGDKAAAEAAGQFAESEETPDDSGDVAAEPEPEEAPEVPAEDSAEDEPAEAPAVEEAAAEPADDLDAAPDDDEFDSIPEDDSAPETVPEVEVLDESIAEGTASYELEDGDIFKATGGSHSRVGQSAFGIDFGFLEEYEAEYEHALEEFRRLRDKTQEEDS
ncbi:MAG: hypothetical protein Q4D27_05325 [Coriobacteriia bacterium]|nr:hypothetical protein [Coriobacteriia bacterium]